MSLIDEDSVDSARSELELFEIQPTQTSIEESRFEHFYPLTTLDRGGPVEFKVSLGEDEYIDTNETFLYLKATIVDADGKAMAGKPKAGETIPAKSVVFPINYFIGSCFRQIEVSLNSKPIGGNEGLYPYRAYMETLLSYGAEAKKISWLQVCTTKTKTKLMYMEPRFLPEPRKTKVQSLDSIEQSLVKVLNVMVEFIVKFSNKKNYS